MALGFDREDACRPDEDVIDVPAPGRYVMDREPAVIVQAVEDLADVFLPVRAAPPTVDERCRMPLDRQQAKNQHDLGADGDPTKAEYCDHRRTHRQHSDSKEPAPCVSALGCTRML